ncbi:MAG: RNA pyrophosphohydrolase [Alphaproteobacteria bacterium]
MPPNIKKINRENLLYRPCVGIALFNKTGKVFVGERIDTSGAWQMPQGGVDKGETPDQTALRELKEEVGTDKAEIIKIAERKIRYELPDRLIEKLWNGKYRGQEQTWVAARFTGKDTDIDLNAYNSCGTPPEFSAWQWVDLSQTLDLIVPFKRDIYREVIELFHDI